MTLPDLLQKLAQEMAGSSQSTVRHFRSVMEGFYHFSKGEFTRAAVVSYIQRLEKKGYSAGTRRTTYSILKRGFDIAHTLDGSIIWPFGKKPPSELPVDVAEWEVNAPILPLEELKTMIAGAKDGTVPGPAAAILAVSSIYGLRRIEMIELKPENMDIRRGVLTPNLAMRVTTVKHGRAHEHLVPEELRPYLEQYPFQAYSPVGLSNLYHQIRQAVGLEIVHGSGWHSIRRLVASSLLFIYPLPLVKAFLRWKMGSMDIAMTYFKMPAKQVDRMIFGLESFPSTTGEMVTAEHPFLKLWRDGK